MGHDLLISSPVASDVITQLQDSLDTLPEDHQPSWTLRDELSASPEQSRISEAELSQPLCTAVQIILVELLRLAGIQFSAVVGHSSGEIGAAYAAVSVLRFFNKTNILFEGLSRIIHWGSRAHF